MKPAHHPRFQLERVRLDDRSDEIRLSGELEFDDAAELWVQLRKHVRPRRRRKRSKLTFDLGDVTKLDGAAAALLTHVRSELSRRGVHSEFSHAHGSVREVIELFESHSGKSLRPPRRAPPALAQLGRATEKIALEAKGLLAFIGDFTLSSVRVLWKPSSANWRDLMPIMERAGADAVPIVMLISFLVGLVSAAQAAAQLERYGANMFVADLVGISMARELGPLMTSIVVTGRSGAAFAAELGTMRVREEIDALTVMGFSPMRFLVLPRVLALLCVLPLLVLFSNAMGATGGLVIGVTRLGLSSSAYINRLTEAVQLWDVGLGLTKSALFALAIGTVSCQQGFATRGGAAAVGQRTTSAVVGILFSLILIDAAFAVAVGAAGR